LHVEVAANPQQRHHPSRLHFPAVTLSPACINASPSRLRPKRPVLTHPREQACPNRPARDAKRQLAPADNLSHPDGAIAKEEDLDQAEPNLREPDPFPPGGRDAERQDAEGLLPGRRHAGKPEVQPAEGGKEETVV